MTTAQVLPIRFLKHLSALTHYGQVPIAIYALTDVGATASSSGSALWMTWNHGLMLMAWWSAFSMCTET
ncbi:hypothetical protein N7541_001716 [Penicillium brevicompactum]|uniref:Uncharacterized protein n=1 Tax=Penicillium brevicompactum TaxID=5074 RepID=A0A9W9RWT8_PENBR|nr:hypothetical protein N7541_001716 [Penicillium brevicompactum]